MSERAFNPRCECGKNLRLFVIPDGASVALRRTCPRCNAVYSIRMRAQDRIYTQTVISPAGPKRRHRIEMTLHGWNVYEGKRKVEGAYLAEYEAQDRCDRLNNTNPQEAL